MRCMRWPSKQEHAKQREECISQAWGRGEEHVVASGMVGSPRAGPLGEGMVR